MYYSIPLPKKEYEEIGLAILTEIPESTLLTQFFAKLTSLGRIHSVSTGIEPS
ncbi:MAG: hypothetical protein V7K89_33955 [Nostoc sp.]|uniref:hypothetical protein n=1 Tax=Nostoc sp. TaxID=1180 RepID=UPI002FF7F309